MNLKAHVLFKRSNVGARKVRIGFVGHILLKSNHTQLGKNLVLSMNRGKLNLKLEAGLGFRV